VSSFFQRFRQAAQIAVLGDIHANLEALEAVLADIRSQGVLKIACTGDIVGYGADPFRCVEIIRDLNCPVVQGNHDLFAANEASLDEFNDSARHAMGWTRKQLSSEAKQWLLDLPLEFNESGLKFVHSSCHEPEEWHYVLKASQAESSFAVQEFSISFFGHTHVPVAFFKEGDQPAQGSVYKKVKLDPSKKWMINPGSVGQPRDRDPRASYAIYDPSKALVFVRRVEYDIVTAQRKIKNAGRPLRNADRLMLGK